MWGLRGRERGPCRYTAGHEHCVLKCDNADFFPEYGHCAARDHHALLPCSMRPSTTSGSAAASTRPSGCCRYRYWVASSLRYGYYPSIHPSCRPSSACPHLCGFDGPCALLLSPGWITFFPSPPSPPLQAIQLISTYTSFLTSSLTPPCRPSSTSARTPMRCAPPAGSLGRGRCTPTPWGPRSTSGPQPSSRGEDDAPRPPGGQGVLQGLSLVAGERTMHPDPLGAKEYFRASA